MTNYYIGQEPEIWNAFASSVSTVRSSVEREWERRVFRIAFPHLSNSELRVWLFIKSRTLDWQKFAEAIPMTHFLHGMRDQEGELIKGQDGVPFTSGCGISKEDTVRGAVKSLLKRQVITVFPGKRGSATPANVYMPLGRGQLARCLIEAESGVLPTCAPFTPGEHVRRISTIWRVTEIEGDFLHLRRLLNGNILSHERASVRKEEVDRLTVEEWKELTRRKLRAAA